MRVNDMARKARGVYNTHMVKTLKFAPELVPLILNGTKTVTWRLFDDKNLAPGDHLDFTDKATGKKFATAEITAIREKPLGDIDDHDFAEGHERYADRAAMVAEFRKYYGEMADENTRVKIIKFRIIIAS